MKTWVIKIGTSILRGTKETSTEEIIDTLSRSFTDFLSKGIKLILYKFLLFPIHYLSFEYFYL